MVLLLVLWWWWFCRTRRLFTTSVGRRSGFHSVHVLWGACIHRGSPAHHCPLWWWRWLGGPFKCAAASGGPRRRWTHQHTHTIRFACVRVDFVLFATHTHKLSSIVALQCRAIPVYSSSNDGTGIPAAHRLVQSRRCVGVTSVPKSPKARLNSWIKAGTTNGLDWVAAHSWWSPWSCRRKVCSKRCHNRSCCCWCAFGDDWMIPPEYCGCCWSDSSWATTRAAKSNR